MACWADRQAWGGPQPLSICLLHPAPCGSMKVTHKAWDFWRSSRCHCPLHPPYHCSEMLVLALQDNNPCCWWCNQGWEPLPKLPEEVPWFGTTYLLTGAGWEKQDFVPVFTGWVFPAVGAAQGRVGKGFSRSPRQMPTSQRCSTARSNSSPHVPSPPCVCLGWCLLRHSCEG